MKHADETTSRPSPRGAAPMFAPYRTAAASYKALDLETQVAEADPHRLIEMLYDGGVVAIAKARVALARGDFAEKGQSTTKAIRIIDEGLKASLDHRAGGAISTNLAALYDYMTQSLIEANLRNDDTRFGEVEKLLDDLRGAWREIGPQVRGNAPQRRG